MTLSRVRAIESVDRQLLLVTSASLLLSPLGWMYYLWLLMPPLVATIHAWRVTGPTGSGWILTAGLVGFLVPPFVPAETVSWGGGVGAATVGSVYFWALGLVWFTAMNRSNDLPRRLGVQV